MDSASCSSPAAAGRPAPDYGARPIKETQIDLWGPPLTAAGYTVFAINHRGAPRFHFPGGDRGRAARDPLRARAREGLRHRRRTARRPRRFVGRQSHRPRGACSAAPGIRDDTDAGESRVRRRCRPSCCARPSADLRTARPGEAWLRRVVHGSRRQRCARGQGAVRRRLAGHAGVGARASARC